MSLKEYIKENKNAEMKIFTRIARRVVENLKKQAATLRQLQEDWYSVITNSKKF